jgi:hypothetical protein
MEVLMMRYILEIEKDSSLIKLFGNGWYPNIDKYRLFLHKQEKNNQNLAKLIMKYHLVKSSDHLIETVASSELDNISFFLQKEANVIESSYGTIHVEKEIPIKMDYPCCYISNGFYNDTESIALSLVNRGSFVVGVCDNPDSIFYQENLKRIKEFEKILHKKHIPYHAYHHTNHRDKCLVLAYRREEL